MAKKKDMQAINEVENRILDHANREWFSSRCRCPMKMRITREQADCVIKAWLHECMPALEGEDLFEDKACRPVAR